MKHYSAVIGALFVVALAISGCGMEVTKTVTIEKTVTASPSPTATAEPSPAPSPALSDEELEVYEFVTTNYPAVKKLWTHTDKMINRQSNKNAAISALADDGTAFAKIAQKWNDLDFVSGRVNSLEGSFDQYMNGCRAYYKNWLNGITGGNIDQCAENAVKASFKIDRWGPRVESELDRLEALSGEVY